MEVIAVKVKLTEVKSGYRGISRVSRFSSSQRSKMIIAASLVGVFLFVYIISVVGILPVEAVGARLSSLVSDDKKFPLDISASSTEVIDNLGDNIFALTVDNFTLYSPSGKVIYTKAHSYASPTVSINGDNAVVFDRGDVGYMLINHKKIVKEDNFTDPIICAEYGKSGNYALGTRSSSATSMLTVYSATNKLKFQWKCAYEHIVSIALSDNGRYAGAAVVGADNGEIFTTVQYFGFDYSEPVNTQTVKGAAPFNLEFTDRNILTLFSDVGIFKITKKSETTDIITAYYSSEFNSYDYADNGKYVVSLAKYGSANNFSISVYSSKGKAKANIDADYSIKSVTMSDKYIFALAENKVIVYNLRGKVVSNINIKGDATSVCGTDRFAYISSRNKITRCYSYGDSSIEILS